jgi:hypothetical protein
MLNLESILIDVAAVVEVKRRNQNLASVGDEIGWPRREVFMTFGYWRACFII